MLKERGRIETLRRENHGEANVTLDGDGKGYGEKWWRRVSWWPMAVGPLGIAASVVLSRFWPAEFLELQGRLEGPAPYLVAVAGAIYAVRAIYTFNPLYVILTALCTALVCREIHFSGTHRGIYVALVVVGVWALWWRKRLEVPLRDRRHTSWLLATLAAYFLSQLIARRAFKFVPGEHAIHRSLEECAETAAHAMLIVTSLIGNWRRDGRGAQKPQPRRQ